MALFPTAWMNAIDKMRQEQNALRTTRSADSEGMGSPPNMVSRAVSPSSNIQDSIPDDSGSQPQPMTHGLFGSRQDQQTGPEEYHPFDKKNLLSSLLSIVLPTAYSAATDNGILPGLMGGLASIQGRGDAKDDQSQKNYLAAQDNALDREYKESTIDANIGNAKEKIRHNRVTENIAANKPEKLTESAEYNKNLKLLSDYAGKGQRPPSWLRDSVEAYESKNKIQLSDKTPKPASLWDSI